MTESANLVDAMEAGAAPLPSETPLVAGVTKLRPDLWQQLHTIKQGPGFTCAAAKTACADVELVHAGNEYRQQQWRHAKPYMQISKNLICEAEALAQGCPARIAPASRP